jgi:hypothetical protein
MKRQDDPVATARAALQEATAGLAAHDEKKLKLEEQAAKLTHDLDAATLVGDERTADALAAKLAATERRIGSLDRIRPQLVARVQEAEAKLREAEQEQALARETVRKQKAAALNERATKHWQELRRIRAEFRSLQEENTVDLQADGLPVRPLPRWLLDRGDVRAPEAEEIRNVIDTARLIGVQAVSAP